MQLDDLSKPEPDFAVLKPRQDGYRDATPQAHEVLLTIKIADSSLAYDRAVKRSLYARHGIPEFWIVNLRQMRWRCAESSAVNTTVDLTRRTRWCIGTEAAAKRGDPGRGTAPLD